MGTMSSKLNVALHFYIFLFFVYISEKKNLFNSLKVLVEVFIGFIIINKLNSNQALIQIKRLEKVQYINSAQW